MPEPVKVNVVSYGRVKPGQLVVVNGRHGEKTTLFDAATAESGDSRFTRYPLTSWNVDLPRLGIGNSMFQYCTSLTSWEGTLPVLTKGNNMFAGCASLASWNVDLPSLTTGRCMFQNCSGMTSWKGTLKKMTEGYFMFQGCTSLKTWNGNLEKLTDGTAMFSGCSLEADSVQQILTTIPDRAAAGFAAATLSIGKRTRFATDPEVKALLGETGEEITAKTYNCKGWNVVVDN